MRRKPHSLPYKKGKVTTILTNTDDAILLFRGDEYVKYKLEDTTYVSASTMIGYVKKNSYEDYL